MKRRLAALLPSCAVLLAGCTTLAPPQPLARQVPQSLPGELAAYYSYPRQNPHAQATVTPGRVTKKYREFIVRFPLHVVLAAPLRGMGRSELSEADLGRRACCQTLPLKFTPAAENLSRATTHRRSRATRCNASDFLGTFVRDNPETPPQPIHLAERWGQEDTDLRFPPNTPAFVQIRVIRGPTAWSASCRKPSDFSHE